MVRHVQTSDFGRHIWDRGAYCGGPRYFSEGLGRHVKPAIPHGRPCQVRRSSEEEDVQFMPSPSFLCCFPTSAYLNQSSGKMGHKTTSEEKVRSSSGRTGHQKRSTCSHSRTAGPCRQVSSRLDYLQEHVLMYFCRTMSSVTHTGNANFGQWLRNCFEIYSDIIQHRAISSLLMARYECCMYWLLRLRWRNCGMHIHDGCPDTCNVQTLFPGRPNGIL